MMIMMMTDRWPVDQLSYCCVYCVHGVSLTYCHYSGIYTILGVLLMACSVSW